MHILIFKQLTFLILRNSIILRRRITAKITDKRNYMCSKFKVAYSHLCTNTNTQPHKLNNPGKNAHPMHIIGALYMTVEICTYYNFKCVSYMYTSTSVYVYLYIY